MHAQSVLLIATMHHCRKEAADVLGISDRHLRRVLRRIEAQAADPSPIRELRRRRSELAMSELAGGELRNAIGVFGNETALRR